MNGRLGLAERKRQASEIVCEFNRAHAVGTGVRITLEPGHTAAYRFGRTAGRAYRVGGQALVPVQYGGRHNAKIQLSQITILGKAQEGSI